MMDGAISYNLSLVDPGSDVSLLAFPIYPLPAGMVLMPMPPSDQSSPDRPSQREHRFQAVSSSCDLSREGPFEISLTFIIYGRSPGSVDSVIGALYLYSVV